ncbi:MFS transporter [Herbidospora sp. RD11066]
MFGGLPRVFWFLFSGQLVNRFGGMVVPFLVTYLALIGYSPGEIGLVMAVYGVGGLFGQLLGGILADRFGYRDTLVTGLVTTACCVVLVGLAEGLAPLVCAAGALGVAADVYMPAARALVAETVPGELRAKAFGLLHWAYNIGAAVCGVVAAALLANGYWILVALDAVTSTIFAILVWRGVPRARPVRPAKDARARPGRFVLLVLGLMLLNSLVYAQQRYGLPLDIVADGLPGSFYGVLITVNAVLIVATQPFVVAFLARFPKLAVLGASWALIGIGLALSGPAETTWQYLGSVLIWTLGEIGMAGFGAALIADLTPGDAHGTYQGLYGWTNVIPRLAGPLLGAGLYELGALWWFCLVAGLLGGAVAFSGWR